MAATKQWYILSQEGQREKRRRQARRETAGQQEEQDSGLESICGSQVSHQHLASVTTIA